MIILTLRIWKETISYHTIITCEKKITDNLSPSHSLGLRVGDFFSPLREYQGGGLLAFPSKQLKCCGDYDFKIMWNSNKWTLGYQTYHEGLQWWIRGDGNVENAIYISYRNRFSNEWNVYYYFKSF